MVIIIFFVLIILYIKKYFSLHPKTYCNHKYGYQRNIKKESQHNIPKYLDNKILFNDK